MDPMGMYPTIQSSKFFFGGSTISTQLPAAAARGLRMSTILCPVRSSWRQRSSRWTTDEAVLLQSMLVKLCALFFFRSEYDIINESIFTKDGVF